MSEVEIEIETETDVEIDETPETWITCVVDNEYEINTVFPFQIRKKKNQRIIKESIKKNEYVICHMSRKQYYKHRVIAQQFIPNPDNLPQVDHLNNIETDNRLVNLRWCTSSQNNFNRTGKNGYKYEFVDDIPDEAIVVSDYRGHEFENLYFHNDVFYYFNGVKYRKKRVLVTKAGYLSIRCVDVEGKHRAISYVTFKREYDIVGSGIIEE